MSRLGFLISASSRRERGLGGSLSPVSWRSKASEATARVRTRDRSTRSWRWAVRRTVCSSRSSLFFERSTEHTSFGFVGRTLSSAGSPARCLLPFCGHTMIGHRG